MTAKNNIVTPMSIPFRKNVQILNLKTFARFFGFPDETCKQMHDFKKLAISAILYKSNLNSLRNLSKTAEKSILKGEYLGPLHGIPFAVKDLFDVNGFPTMAGSRLLKFNIARKDSCVVRRMHLAGMILLGKTHTVQFAYSGIGINHDKELHIIRGNGFIISRVAPAADQLWL